MGILRDIRHRLTLLDRDTKNMKALLEGENRPKVLTKICQKITEFKELANSELKFLGSEGELPSRTLASLVRQPRANSVIIFLNSD